MKNAAKERSFIDRVRLINEYYKRSGFYKFVIGNIAKVLGVIAVLIIILVILNSQFDLQAIFLKFAEAVHPAIIFIIFYVSETILGLIPPDFFIAWAKSGIFENHWFITVILSLISYAGGITAYKLGSLSLKVPRLNLYLEKKYAKYSKHIRKWGGIVVVIAALFPLPFATICLVAGMLKYPFGRLLLYGSTRILRFIGYAFVIFYFMSK